MPNKIQNTHVVQCSNTNQPLFEGDLFKLKGTKNAVSVWQNCEILGGGGIFNLPRILRERERERVQQVCTVLATNLLYP